MYHRIASTFWKLFVSFYMPESFGTMLRMARGNASQVEFAKKLQISRALLCHYEVGRREPKLKDFVDICLRLKKTPDWMLGFCSSDGSKVAKEAISARETVSARTTKMSARQKASKPPRP